MFFNKKFQKTFTPIKQQKIYKYQVLGKLHF